MKNTNNDYAELNHWPVVAASQVCHHFEDEAPGGRTRRDAWAGRKGRNMAKLLQHILVNINEDRALGRLNALPDIEWRALRPDGEIDGFLADQTIAEEWPVAEARHAQLTRTADGAPTRGGVNPGDQRTIFTLVRALKPRRVLEVGTHLGYSTLHICQALQLNGCGALTTVDILDVNDPDDAPWTRAKALGSPRQSIAALGYDDHVSFVQSDSIEFLRTTEKTFDFVFLDGDHAAPQVYEELQLLQRVMEPGATLLLHDYFPNGRGLWKGSLPNTGPWKAVQRLRREGAPINVRPLGALPWPTKMGTNLTSLAVATRG